MSWSFSAKSWRFAALPLALVAAAGLLSPGRTVAADGVEPPPAPPARANQEGLFALPGELPKDLPTGSLFKYDVKLEQEKFYLFVPPGYRGREPYGLMAFINADDYMEVPRDWKGVLGRHKLLYVAPQNVGNHQEVSRRALLAVVAIRKMMELYKVDPKRVYLAGFSGGAKVVCLVALVQPELVRGALPICGFIFPSLKEKDRLVLEKAKSQVGIALITGPKDPNHGSIWSGYNDRLVPGKYRAKVFDVPGMGHQIARGQTLNAALGWIEAGNKKAGGDRGTD
jgi:predicted esterase